MDDSKGWISLHRTLINHELWTQEKFTRGQAWVDLLLLANHTDGSIRRRGIKVNVKRGEVGMGLRELATRWQWSVNKIRRFFDELKTDTQIHYRTDTESVNVTTLICITNYENFQAVNTETDTETETDTRRIQNNNENKKTLKTSCPKPEKTSAPDRPIFDFTTGTFSNLEAHLTRWQEAYPAVGIDTELKKAAAWLIANPKNRKSNYARFLNSWLSKAQDRAPKQQPAVHQATDCLPLVSAEQSAGIRQVLERMATNAA